MPIEKLHIMPVHEKVSDGYSYNPKYVGNVYQINDQLVYFKEKSVIEYPMKVIETIKNEVLESIDANLQTVYETLSNIENTIKNNSNNDLKEYIDKSLTDIDPQIKSIEVLSNSLTTINSEISKLKNQLVTKKELIETIDKVIDHKLTEVYNNFNSVTKQLVTEAVTNALKDSKRDQTGKLKITTLMMLKEMGLTPDEIIKYTESGIV